MSDRAVRIVMVLLLSITLAGISDPIPYVHSAAWWRLMHGPWDQSRTATSFLQVASRINAARSAWQATLVGGRGFPRSGKGMYHLCKDPSLSVDVRGQRLRSEAKVQKQMVPVHHIISA